MGTLFAQFVGDISSWNGDTPPCDGSSQTRKNGDGAVTRRRKDATLNKLRKKLVTVGSQENEDGCADPITGTRCIARQEEDEDPDLPDCEPLYQY